MSKTQKQKPVFYNEFEGFSLKNQGITVKEVYRNASTSKLYEQSLKFDSDTTISSTGALICYSGEKTGRSPQDKRVVDEKSSTNDVWWGPVNFKTSEDNFRIQKQRAVDYLNTQKRVYVFDGYTSWDKKYRVKVRLITRRPYHALFLANMLIPPTPQELKEDFKNEPDFVIYNAGGFPAHREKKSDSGTIIALNLGSKEIVILGSEYAGEMKKGIFTYMHYLMPKKGCLSLHSSCNKSKTDDKNVTVFFGLSGTGKTTLSTSSKRYMVGDDEHVWTDDGVFNIEGGCYAKCDNLNPKHEPEIWSAIKFGALLENVVYDPVTREVDFTDLSITDNTRLAYPLNYVDVDPDVKKLGLATHPTNIILLTCDCFGVLPPVSKITLEQTQFHFISGYTAKVAGTEVGVASPQATFSACFGSPFLVLHPMKYAELLAEKMKKYKTNAWLINTGWTGGKYGVGSRIKLAHTKAIVDAINDGLLIKEEFEQSVFQLLVPKKCPGVPTEILNPKNTWKDKNDYDVTLKKLKDAFVKNFDQYKSYKSFDTSLIDKSL